MRKRDKENEGTDDSVQFDPDERARAALEDEPTPPDQGRAALVRYDPLQLYLSKIKEYKPLSREEEFELAARYRATGDKEAALKLVTSNLALVVKLAFEFRFEFQNMLDLIQEGNYGLMRAVKKFDPFRKTRLSTYASYWIRAYIIKFLLDNWRLVKVGTTNTRRKLLFNLKEVEQKLKSGGAQVDVKLLAEHFGAKERDVIDVQASLGATDKSIDAPIEEDSSSSLANRLAGFSGDYASILEEDETKRRLNEALEIFRKDLKPSDRTILDKRIVAESPLTLSEIGQIHNVTREAIRQAEERLMRRLKTFLRSKLADEKIDRQ